MTDEAIQYILYLLGAWERGADAEEYVNEIEALRQSLLHPVKSYTNGEPQYATEDMSTKSQNVYTSEERVHKIDKSIHEEIERLKAEIKRANELAEYVLKLLMQMPENKPWDTSDMAHRSGGLSDEQDADEWYEKALWGEKQEPFKPDWDMIEPYHERIKELEIENEKLRRALAQPEQEPVAWVRDLTSPQPHCVTSLKYLSIADTDAGVKYIPVYTAPPSKPWVSLTDDEFDNIYYRHDTYDSFARAIEAALRSKNT